MSLISKIYRKTIPQRQRNVHYAASERGSKIHSADTVSTERCAVGHSHPTDGIGFNVETIVCLRSPRGEGCESVSGFTGNTVDGCGSNFPSRLTTHVPGTLA